MVNQIIILINVDMYHPLNAIMVTSLVTKLNFAGLKNRSSAKKGVPKVTRPSEVRYGFENK